MFEIHYSNSLLHPLPKARMHREWWFRCNIVAAWKLCQTNALTNIMDFAVSTSKRKDVYASAEGASDENMGDFEQNRPKKTQIDTPKLTNWKFFS